MATEISWGPHRVARSLTLVATGAFLLLWVGCGDDSTPPDGAVGMDAGCTCPMGEVCVDGMCVDSACGDGVLDEANGEACDDGNRLSGDGCEADCQFSCTEDTQCDDGEPCNGAEVCNTTVHRCQLGEPLQCDDGEVCTVDSCVEGMGCVFTLEDEDADGFAPAMCDSEEHPGGDCDDDNVRRFPGATELCNEIDDDCDGMVDEGLATLRCYADRDGDGFGNEDSLVESCACAEGTIPLRDDGRFDCDDRRALVNPDQRMTFTEDRCGGETPCSRPFDYDCDGVERMSSTRRHTGCGLISSGGMLGCSGSGWFVNTAGFEPPACGTRGSFATCGFDDEDDCVRLDLSVRTQACR